MSWRMRKVGELVDNFSERARDNGGAEDLPFLGVSNEDGITTSKYAAEDKAEEYKIIEPGCFAYNPYRINVGSIAYMEGEKKGLISPAYVVFKPKPKSVKPELLLKFLKSSEGLRQIKLHARGTVRQALRFEDLCQIELSLPDYCEQEKLLHNLNSSQSEAKKLGFELAQQNSILFKLRQALLKEAIQGKLVKQEMEDGHAKDLLEKIKEEKAKLIAKKKLKKEKPLPPIKEEEVPFDIPENWVWCRLGEVVTNIFDGPFGSHLKTADYTDSGVQVIRLQNLGVMKFKAEKETFITQEKYSTISQHTVYEGDVLIGSFLADGVNCVVLPKLKHTSIAKADCFTIRIKHDFFLNTFVMYLLSSDIMFIELSKLLRGMTRLRINTTQLKQLPIPLPPLNEQKRIVKKLEQIMQVCDELQQSILRSQRENERLLQQVLREALQNKELAP